MSFLVDDRLASGYTVLAAVRCAWESGTSKVVVVVPTGFIRALKLVTGEASKVYCANVRGAFLGWIRENLEGESVVVW